MGPGKDTHGTPMPAKEGRGWPTTRSTVRQTCTPKRQTPLSFSTYMVAEPCSVQFSSDRIQQRTERRYVGQEVDGQFVGSRKRVSRHQHSGDETALQHRPRAGRSQSVDKKCKVCWCMSKTVPNHHEDCAEKESVHPEK